MNDGWLKLFYRFKEWEWYADTNMVRLFIHLLLSASFQPQKWRGKDIPRGSLVTSRSKLVAETNLSPREIRTCIERLKTTNEITVDATNQYTIITICNFDHYQGKRDESEDRMNELTESHRPAGDQRPTSDRPATDQPIEEEGKNIYTTTSSTNNNLNIAGERDITITGARTRDCPEAIPLTFDGLKKKILADQTFWEHGAMTLHISIDLLRAYLLDFINEQKAIGNTPEDYSDFRRHFFSWARIAADKQRRSQKKPQSYVTTTNTQQHNDPAEARHTAFARHIASRLNTPDSPEPDVSGLY